MGTHFSTHVIVAFLVRAEYYYCFDYSTYKWFM